MSARGGLRAASAGRLLLIRGKCAYAPVGIGVEHADVTLLPTELGELAQTFTLMR